MADLPKPYLSAHSAALLLGPNVDEALYTADQLRAYAAAKVAEERAKWVAEAAAFEQTMSRLSQTIDRISANVDSAIHGAEAPSARVQPLP